MKPSFKIERQYWKKGIGTVVGIDEVGRGAFAGPLVAAGVVFPSINKITKRNKFLKEINDSKQLKAGIRRKLAKKIIKYALFYSIQEIDITTINKIGIGKANQEIIKRIATDVLARYGSRNTFAICDGFSVRGLNNHKAIIDGDCKSITIAAASIIAKVHRDKIMKNYSREYHHYKFARNKGYGTKAHREALKQYGLTDIHRTSFELNKFLSQ